MISFRYHIVSIVSVFLALAVGVALGGGPLKGEVDNTLVEQVRSDRQVKADLRVQIAALRGGNQFTDDFAATVAPTLLGGRLRGRVVTMVVLPTARQAEVADLAQLVVLAGARLGGTLRVGTDLLDSGQKQFVEALGTRLQSRAKGVVIPADAGPYERIGALVARAIGATAPGGAAVDPAAESLLTGLGTADLLSPEGRLSRRGDLVLFVAGPGRGGAVERTGTSSIITSLVQAVDAGTAGVVLAGPQASAREGGPVKAVRDDVSAGRVVSTVDSLGRTAGQVVTVMALAGQAAGRSGHYGSVDAADGAMPGARDGE